MKSLFTVSTTILTLLFLGVCQPSDTGNTQTTASVSVEEDATGQLQHNVYFYLKEDVTAEQKQEFEEALKELMNIPQIHKYEMGIPGLEEEENDDQQFAYSFFTWFKTMEDYNGYAEHPDHLAFIDAYSNLWADIKVYDTKISYAGDNN